MKYCVSMIPSTMEGWAASSVEAEEQHISPFIFTLCRPFQQHNSASFVWCWNSVRFLEEFSNQQLNTVLMCLDSLCYYKWITMNTDLKRNSFVRFKHIGSVFFLNANWTHIFFSLVFDFLSHFFGSHNTDQNFAYTKNRFDGFF